jgi:hypothetical protein
MRLGRRNSGIWGALLAVMLANTAGENTAQAACGDYLAHARMTEDTAQRGPQTADPRHTGNSTPPRRSECRDGSCGPRESMPTSEVPTLRSDHHWAWCERRGDGWPTADEWSAPADAVFAAREWQDSVFHPPRLAG